MPKKSSVNKAGNYTKPALRKRLFNSIKARKTMGTNFCRSMVCKKGSVTC